MVWSYAVSRATAQATSSCGLLNIGRPVAVCSAGTSSCTTSQWSTSRPFLEAEDVHRQQRLVGDASAGIAVVHHDEVALGDDRARLDAGR
jgi:hypothetical protein